MIVQALTHLNMDRYERAIERGHAILDQDGQVITGARAWRDQFIAEIMRRRNAPAPGMLAPLLEDIAGSPEVRAEVNHGRWLAPCPFCSGAELVDESIRLFFCLSCYNRQAGYQFLRVLFPRDMREIEDALERRPMTDNQNWHYGETVEDLQTENTREGIR